MPRIFVYGTLKEGHPNHRWIEAHAKEADALIPNMKLFDAGLPMAVRAELIEGSTGHPLMGEIYDIPMSLFFSLDRMERGAGYTQDTEGLVGLGTVFFWPVPGNPKKLRPHASITEVKPRDGVLEWRGTALGPRPRP